MSKKAGTLASCSKIMSNLFTRRNFLRHSAAAAGSSPGVLASQTSPGMSLVEAGKPAAAIVIPRDATPLERFAAEELRDHISLMSGAQLPIGNSAPAGTPRVLIGRSAENAGVAVRDLPPEHYRIKTIAGALCLAGHDRGDKQADPLDLSDVQPGTLFAVYDLLDRALGVRWLWPGDLGTHAPKQDTITIPDLDLTGGPRLVQRKMRTLRGRLEDMKDFTTEGVNLLPADLTERLRRDELLWLRRQQMGKRENLPFGHSFTRWWAKYGQSHPEYFAKLPNRKQPYPKPDRVKLCVSNPAVVEQIVRDWQQAGAGPTLAACPNDSRAYCTCERCREWDKPEITTPENVDKSILTYRYVRFWNAIAEKAAAINPKVVVCGYAYTNYRVPPVGVKLHPNIALGYIGNPSSVPHRPDGDDLQAHWEGWSRAGAKLFFRPNWTCAGHMTPYLPLHDSGSFIKFAYEHNMLGTDFDSLFSRWATQGAWYYVIGRLHMRPDLSVEAVIGEYVSGFAKAAPAIRKYLDYWEKFTAERTAVVAPGMYTIVEHMPELFTDEALAPAQSLLDEAARLAQSDAAEARARVQFLNQGLKHVRLTRDAVRAVSAARAAGKIENAPELVRTIYRLREFRRAAAPKHQDWTEWSDLWEVRMGDQTGALLTHGLNGRIPSAALPLRWNFCFDPDNRGEREGWYTSQSGDWLQIPIAEGRPQLPAADKSAARSRGPLWYTTSFTAANTANGATLLFSGVGGACRIWLNGKPLGERTGISFELPVVLSAGVNTLAVRVQAPAGKPGLYRPVWIL